MLLPPKPTTNNPERDQRIFDLRHELFWDTFVLGRGSDGDDPELEERFQELKRLIADMESDGYPND